MTVLKRLPLASDMVKHESDTKSIPKAVRSALVLSSQKKIVFFFYGGIGAL